MKTAQHDTVWEHVHDGAVVDYRRGTYFVTRDRERDPRAVTLTCAPKRCAKCPHEGRPSPGAAVLVLFPGHPHYVTPPTDRAAASVHEALAEDAQAVLAEALMTVRLGARTVGTIEDGDTVFTCPPLNQMRARDLRHHLVLFHDLSGLTDGADADLTAVTPARLVEIHKATKGKPTHTH